jgi:hypothetical protein
MQRSCTDSLLLLLSVFLLNQADGFAWHGSTVHPPLPISFLDRSLRSSPRWLLSLPAAQTRNRVIVKALLDDEEEDEDEDDEDDEEDDDEDEDEDDEDPLSKGIDSVSWLPSVVGAKGSTEALKGTREGAEIMPLFPLGGIVYTPNSEHVLNIFEPRYKGTVFAF